MREGGAVPLGNLPPVASTASFCRGDGHLGSSLQRAGHPKKNTDLGCRGCTKLPGGVSPGQVFKAPQHLDPKPAGAALGVFLGASSVTQAAPNSYPSSR